MTTDSNSPADVARKPESASAPQTSEHAELLALGRSGEHTAAYNLLVEKPTPLEITSTEGCYLITAEGRRILDAGGGAIVVNVGHGRDEVADTAAASLRATDYVVPPFATPARVDLVTRLRKNWLPEGLVRVGFAAGGSEGMDMALRLARQHQICAGRPGRWRILGRELSYHGTTLATLSVGGHTKRRKGFEPWLVDLLTDQPRPPAHYCYRCPLDKTYPSCNVACADEVERCFEQAGTGTVAAFVVEPVVGSNAGALVPPDEYLPRVAEICAKHDVLLIADEVMTGFGRTGTKFGVDHWGVVPDILVSGKGLSGGYAPLAAVATSERVMEPIRNAGDQVMFYTYGGHSLSCAIADKVLEIIEREDLVTRAATMGRKLEQALAQLASHPHIGEIRGRGLLWAVEVVEDKTTRAPFPASAHLADKITAAGLDEDVFFYPGGNDPARDVVCLGPPFTLGQEEIDLIVERLPRAIDTAVARLDS